MRLLRVAGTTILATIAICHATPVAAAKPKPAPAKKAAAAEPAKPASEADKAPAKSAADAKDSPAAAEAKSETKAPEAKSETKAAAEAAAETPAPAATDAKPAETAKPEEAAAATPAAPAPAEETPANTAEASASAGADVKINAADKGQDKPEAASAAEPGSRGPSPLELRLYGGMLSRQFTYSDNASKNRDFDGTGPIFGLRVALYPAAFALTGIPAHLGIVAGYSRELAPDTAAEPGIPALTTESQEWYVGLKGRLPVQEHELGLELRFVGHDYALSGDEGAESRPCAWNSAIGDRGLPPGVSCFFPDVAYRAFEPMAEGRFNFGRLLLGVHAGVRVVLSTGELADPWWFASASGMGLDAGVFGGFRIIERLHVMVGGNLRQYGFDFNPLVPGRAEGRAPGPVAGGAVDRYVSGWLGLNYALAGRPL